MQGSHTHIPGTNYVPRGYIVAANLFLLFMVPLCLIPLLLLLLLLLKMLWIGTSLCQSKLEIGLTKVNDCLKNKDNSLV